LTLLETLHISLQAWCLRGLLKGLDINLLYSLKLKGIVISLTVFPPLVTSTNSLIYTNISDGIL
jgi:hypothetical protein